MVRLTPHALAQMRRRGLSEAVVRAVVAAPDRVLPGNRPGRRVVQAVAEVGDPPSRALVRVVLDETGSPPAVVTVYVTTQFRRYGAEP